LVVNLAAVRPSASVTMVLKDLATVRDLAIILDRRKEWRKMMVSHL
jgi:hypothetical protein